MKPSFTGPLPNAGGLSGVKRMQMALRDREAVADTGGGMARTRTFAAPRPQQPASTVTAPAAQTPARKTAGQIGYETATRLQAVANPNFPRRRGQK